MKKLIYILLFLIISNLGFSQISDTININNVEYLVIIDSITHKVRECYIIEIETFFEKLYIGSEFYPLEGNVSANLLWDCSEYGKLGIGYNIGHKTLGISAYISIWRLHKRKDKIDIIYF